MTASRMLCGRRSALPVVVEDPEANSDRAEGVLTKGFDFNYRKRAAFVNERSQRAEEEFRHRGTARRSRNQMLVLVLVLVLVLE